MKRATESEIQAAEDRREAFIQEAFAEMSVHPEEWNPVAVRIVRVLIGEPGSIKEWPEELRADCQAIRDRYQELKRRLDFATSDEVAHVEWVTRVLKEQQ